MCPNNIPLLLEVVRADVDRQKCLCDNCRAVVLTITSFPYSKNDYQLMMIQIISSKPKQQQINERKKKL